MRAIDKLDVVGRATLIAVSAGFMIMFGWTALGRMSYPFDLEFIEGSVAAHSLRVAADQPIYLPPTAEFVPAIYPPLYYWVTAPLLNWFGAALWPLRLLSSLSALASFGFIYLIVHRETRSRFSALLAVGMFAASYSVGGFWYDLARPDSLFVFWLLGAVWLLGFERSIFAVLAGLAIGLSFLTKQAGLIAFASLGLYTIWEQRWRSLYFIVPAAVLMIAVTSFMNTRTAGWYGFYVFAVPGSHHLVWQVLYSYWIKDLLVPLTAAAALTAWGLWWLHREGKRTSLRYLGSAIGSLIVVGLIARMKDGSAINNVIPAYAALAIGMGVGSESLRRIVRAQAEQLAQVGSVAAWAGVAGSYLFMICGFAACFYEPWQQIPSAGDRAAYAGLCARVEQAEGSVWSPSHGVLGPLCGRPGGPHMMAAWDVLNGPDRVIAEQLTAILRREIREQKYSVIVLDEPLNPPGSAEDFGLAEYYELNGSALSRRDVLWTKAGVPLAPQEWWTARAAINDR